jgi:hypothetical protein
MKLKMLGALAGLTAVIAAFLIAPAVFAQSGGGYTLTWSTIDGGGATSTGGVYTLRGTVGQPDAGDKLTGSFYALRGGFWNLPTQLVPSPPLATPELNYFASVNVTLTWNRVSFAQGYEVQVDDNSNFSSLVFSSSTLPASALSAPVTVPFNGKFYWRVRAKTGATTWGPWSAVQTFRVNEP